MNILVLQYYYCKGSHITMKEQSTKCLVFRMILLLGLFFGQWCTIGAATDTSSCYDPNCEVCDRPDDEYACRVCKEGYCLEDEEYRKDFYDGLGKCWRFYCNERKTKSAGVNSDLAGKALFSSSVLVGLGLNLWD